MRTTELLLHRYAPPEWLLFGEFSILEGARRLDHVAIGLWRSRGFPIVGFEVKESRADWLRELKDPAKSEEGSAYCDAFFLLAANGVAKVEEVPESWGFLEVRGERLFTIRKAPERTAVPIDRAFMVRALSHLSEKGRRFEEETRWNLRAEIRKEVEAETVRAIDATREKAAREISTLRASVEAFEKASGRSLSWSEGEAKRLGAIVKAIDSGRLPDLSYQEANLAAALEAVKAARAAIAGVGKDEAAA